MLVTGAAGFIGTNFVHFWAEHHPADVIIGLDALTYAGNLSNLEPLANHERFTFIKGDIRDVDAMSAIAAPGSGPERPERGQRHHGVAEPVRPSHDDDGLAGVDHRRVSSRARSWTPVTCGST